MFLLHKISNGNRLHGDLLTLTPDPERVQPVFTELDQRFCSVFVTQTGWRGERRKTHLICSDRTKDDSLMKFLKCKSIEKYITSPQFVSNNIKAFPPIRDASNVN